MLTIITFILILAVLVLVHEFGHFWTARKFGCKVEEFGFGFPPRLFSWRRKKEGSDGTLYTLNLLPLGGFVRLKGEGGEERQDSDSFSHQKPWKRAVILLAGVAMNFLLALVLLTVGYTVGVPQVITDDISSKATIEDVAIRVADILPDSPAQKAGLIPGDAILAYRENDADTAVTSIVELQEYIANHNDREVSLLVRSYENETERYVAITPQFFADAQRGAIGVVLVRTGLVSYPVYMAPFVGLSSAVSLTRQFLSSLVTMIGSLFTSSQTPIDVTGPVGIAKMTGQFMRQGFVYLLSFISLLSLNLAFINVLPFPALDGGRLLFLVIEKIRRKPNNQKIEQIMHLVGFVVLISMVVFVTYKDIVHFF